MINVKLTATHLSGLKQGEREIFSALPISIGRAPTSHLRIAANDTRTSTSHAELSFDGRNIILHDLGSTNGTYINGQRVDKPIKIINGEIVEFGIGGPKLKFEYTLQEVLETNPLGSPMPQKLSGAAQIDEIVNAAVRSYVSNPPPLAPAPVATPPAPVPAVPLVEKTLNTGVDEQEFPFKNRFKYVLFAIAALLLIGAATLYSNRLLVWSIPVGLMGLFLLLMGWSCSRINITVNSKGIYYQGILRSRSIRWEDVAQLKTVRSRTRLLTDLVYTVQGRKGSISFSIEDYQAGLELSQIIARHTGLNW